MTTLARLSFWVPVERLDDFESAYRKKLIPLLGKHGLEESAEAGRPTVEGVFSRLFELERPAEVARKTQVLQGDPAWQTLLRELGTTFETGSDAPIIRYRFGLYSTPAGKGRAVEVGQGYRQGLWWSLGAQDGLPPQAIFALLQDRTGHLWLATQGGGISRYDGAQLVTFTSEDGLAGDEVLSIAEDHKGHLWLGSGNWRGERGAGVSHYDGERFVTFTTEDGLAGNWVSAIVEDQKGNVWFGTDGGVSRYGEGGFTTFGKEEGLTRGPVRCMVEDQRGDLWVGTQAGVCRYDGERFTPCSEVEGLAGHAVLSMMVDREGHLWVRTEAGVSRYDGAQWTRFTVQEGLADNRVAAMKQDQEGCWWFGTWWSGVCRYDGAQWRTFTTEDGLANNQVRAIAEDSEGQLWFGTWSGLSRYDGGRLATFTTKEGLVNDGVMALLEDREGNVWFGTWGGVSRYREGKLVTINSHSTRAMVEDRRGHLWFGWAGGVSRYNGQQWTTFSQRDGPTPEDVLSIAEDREGRLWFGGTPCRVSQYDGEQWKTFTPGDGLAAGDVRAIAADRFGHLWFGTTNLGTDGGAGASRYDGSAWRTFTTEEGLAHNAVGAVVADRKGHLWFGTAGGVSRYDGREFVTFAAAEGLACNKVTAIMEDREGHLWFGTYGGGVSCYDGLVFQSLSRKDGLVHDAVQAILQDRRGHIWIATDGGVTRYRPSRTPPAICLVDVVAGHRYGVVSEFSMPVSQKLLAFEFRGSSLGTRPDGMAYLYRLQGYEEAWKPTYARRVEYQNLPLGEYTFQVKAVDRDLNYSGPASLRLSVVPDPRLEAFKEALSAGGPGEFIGKSEALRQVQQQLARVTETELTVLILGETGTGKGLAARSVHALSPRRAGPFLPVNCGALPRDLVESELFGHEKGAFTSAHTRKIGKVELAQTGTLFLDEIGDLPLEAQVKLLQVLEEKTFERLGGTQTLKADVRVIAATNRDLEQMVKEGRFREDLYYRLQVFPVRLPPLRERQEDIPLLAQYFASRFARHLNRPVPQITSEALSRLQSYAWPGNVRELEHLMQRAVLLCREDRIEAGDVILGPGVAGGEAPAGEGSGESAAQEALLSLDELEKQHIERALEASGGVIYGERGAARLLGVHPDTLRYRIKKHGLRKPG
jgi:DNA-binding NtrC family response regulator/ligand-binding sensor domain-containing protein